MRASSFSDIDSIIESVWTKLLSRSFDDSTREMKRCMVQIDVGALFMQ
jgi:hypothetical protein